MSTCGKNLSLKAYIDGKEASIEIPYQSLFELFEFRKQYEEYAKDVSTPVDYHEPERMIYDSAKLLVKHGVCSSELLQRHFRMEYDTAEYRRQLKERKQELHLLNTARNQS